MVETAEKSFDDFYLSEEILQALRKVGYKRPTPVQVESIPLILAGIDLIVQSQTGSGKTAAFAIPTIEMLEPHPGRVEVLVLAPTRELAKQVCKEFEKLGQFKELSATAIYGGTSYEKQYKALETAQVVAATPGRLLDLLKRGTLDLSNLRILCLDEADEMLSMGFREELNAIVDFLPEERQSLLFSATVNEDIKQLAKGMLYYPEYISLSGDQVAAEAVTHLYYRVKGVGRERDLLKVLEYESPDSALIFANTRDETFTVTKFLQRHGYRAKVLNGDLPQKQREATLADLREGKVDYIVATDVAARGIDITDLSHVFNFSLPSSAEVYIHRTGRTGRAGKSGRAISLVSPADMATHFDIMTLYDIDITHRELPSADEIVAAQEDSRLDRLSDQVMKLKRIPYGGNLGIAKNMLETGADADDERVKVVAKLLSIAESLVQDRTKLDAVTGLASLESKGEAAPTPEATAKRTPAKTEEAAQSKAGGESKRRRERSEAKPSQDKQEAAETQPAPTPEKEERSKGSSRRRRRRSRSSKQRKSTKGSSRRRSRKSSRKSSKRKSGDSKRSQSKKRSGSKKRSQSKKPSESKKSTPPAETPQAPQAAKPEFDTSKMYMNVGRDHFDDEKELLDMICYMSGFAPEDFGDISVQSSYSFVQVREDYFYDIINAMNNQEWKGVNLTAEPARK